VEALTHSIIGLPRSGKTTFLAALWHLLDGGETETQLVIDRLVGDHTYLNAIVESWRRCDEVPRTSRAMIPDITMHLKHKQTGQPVALAFQDLSGESFEDQLASRRCSQNYVDLHSRAGGILLFINVDRGQDGMTMHDIGPAIAGDDASLTSDAREWSPDVVPEQVKLVELLQCLQRAPFYRRRRRLVVALSAWDVIPQGGPSPTEWLAREMPLLDQFIRANRQSFEARIYGISAQGGDFKSERRSELLHSVPSSRVECHGHDAAIHDISAPLVWLSASE